MTLNLEIEHEGKLADILSCETEYDAGDVLEKIAQTVIEKSLDILECPYETEVNLLITGSEETQQLNRSFRGIDRTTDVLSFPMLDLNEEGDFSEIDEEDSDTFNPETGELLLGDIVINSDRVLSQAQEYGHSVKREYAFLITHSVLHLCGYDHMTEDEEIRMRAMQDEILHQLGILR